jgi:hypothetical protein
VRGCAVIRAVNAWGESRYPGEQLRAYFPGDWAFLIPNLALYLLYSSWRWGSGFRVHSSNTHRTTGSSDSTSRATPSRCRFTSSGIV